jgi:nucleotide-binding universal stress UspA family protein
MKILVAIDGSDHSERALEYAAKLANSLHAELAIVTVRPMIIDQELLRFGKIEDVAVGEILERQATDLLVSAKKRATALGAATVSTAVEDGDPATVLLDHCRSGDLLVMGRRGRGRLSGLLLGSVSQKLATLSPVPMVIVP